MLISTNLDDGSSVDSELHGAMPPPALAPSENVNGPSLILEEGVVEGTAAGWNEVTDNFETRSVDDELSEHHHHNNMNTEASGVLIVPGAEEEEAKEDEEEEDLLDKRGISGSEIHLSFEGSIPSEIGSLGDDLDPQIVPESLEGVHEKPADSYHKEQQAVMSEERPPRHFSSYLFVPTVMALVCMSAGSLLLYRERNSLLASVSQLEQQVLELQGDLMKSQQEVERAAAAAAASLSWDSCQNSEGALVDNCWFKANVELGECAQDMKKAVIEHSSYFMDRLEEFGRTPFESTEESSDSSSSFKESDSTSGSVSQAVKLVDRFGKTLWSARVVKEDKVDNQEIPDATNDETNTSYSGFFSTADHFGHFGSSLWKHTVADVSKLSNGMKDATSSLFKYFHSNESSSSSSLSSSSSKSSKSETNSTEGVEDLLQGFSELFTAVSSLGFAAGEALLASTVEMATEVLESNYTLHDLKKAVEDASLTHGIVN